MCEAIDNKVFSSHIEVRLLRYRSKKIYHFGKWRYLNNKEVRKILNENIEK
ncbi:MAG: hypothetical protein ACLTXR_00020 [Clostridia bacterium]